jgi:hypothetical protein
MKIKRHIPKNKSSFRNFKSCGKNIFETEKVKTSNKPSKEDRELIMNE